MAACTISGTRDLQFTVILCNRS